MLTKTKWHCIAAWLLCLQLTTPIMAQTPEQVNLEKYWNYRDRFKKWFTKIGKDQGNGIQLMQRNSKGGGWQQNWVAPFNTGKMETGDALANMGDYMAVLATEYKLLKDANQSTTATLNEIYYVIAAINRLDNFAETYLSFPNNGPGNLNGFIMRDDLPVDFYQDWLDLNPNGISGTNERRDFYSKSRGDAFDTDNPTAFNRDNQMSQDQVIGLFMGFATIIKYVDNVVIQPTPSDLPIYPHTEVQGITSRIMDYIRPMRAYHARNGDEQIIIDFSCFDPFMGAINSVINPDASSGLTMNWIITDPITGNVVNGGGGMSQFFSYALCAAAKYITGIDYWTNVRITANIIPGLCYTCSIEGSADKSDIGALWNGLPTAYINPAQNFSSYEHIGFDVDFCSIFTLPSSFVVNVPIINQLASGSAFNKEYNTNLILTLASIGRNVPGYPNWNASDVSYIAHEYDMEIFDLICNLFEGNSPSLPQSFYLNLLNDAPCRGPNKETPGLLISYNPLNGAPKYRGWNTTNRWAHPAPQSGSVVGEFNGNDYMLLYNLYRLAYGNSTPLPVYENKPCQCNSSSIFKVDNNYTDNDDVDALIGIEPSFENITNLTLAKTVIPRFSQEYNPLGIRLPEFLIHNMSIDAGGQVNTQTDVVLCKGGFLTVNSPNGLVLGDASGSPELSSTLTVRDGTTLMVTGTGGIIVNPNSQIVVEPGGSLIFQRVGHATLNDNAKIIVKPGGNFTYEAEVVFAMQGANTLLDVQGNTSALTLAAGEHLTFTKGSATAGGLAQFANGLITMQTASTFTNDGCRLKIFDIVYNHDATFVLQSNSITDFKFSNDVTLNAGETMPVLKNGALTGGTLVLNSNDDVAHYRNFVLNGNATINSTDCKIRLLKYHFDYYQNGNINLTGDEASLVFGGTINIGTDADLHFNGTGYFGFRLEQDWTDYQNIVGTPTSTITLTGTGKTDRIMQVERLSWVHGNDDMGKLTINNGLVELGELALITIGNPYLINGCRIQGWIQGAATGGAQGIGLLLGGQREATINDVDFYGLESAVRGCLFWTDGAPLNLTNCNFYDCGGYPVEVDAKGLNLDHVYFDVGGANIKGSAMDFASTFRNVTMVNSPGTMIEYTTAGTGSLTLIDNNLSSMSGIIYMGPNELTFKCSNIHATDGRNLIAGLDARIVASPQINPRAGHTNFHSLQGMYLYGINDIQIDQGHNDFSIDYLDPQANSYILEGTFVNCNLTSIPASNNKWYGNRSPLDPYDKTFKRICNGVPKFISVSGILPENIGDCPFEPQTPEPNDELRVHPLLECDVCSEITFGENEIPLNVAIKMAIDTISYDTLRYDLAGVNMLSEILMKSLGYDEESVNILSDLAYVRLKQALSNAYKFGLLRSEDGANPYIDKTMSTILTYKTKSRNTDNDNAEFFSTIDQASVERLINNRVAALEILRDIPNCLILTEEQKKYLDDLFNQYSKEEMVLTGSMSVEEYWNYRLPPQRVFQHFANTQANIDTVLTDSVSFAALPMAQMIVHDSQGNGYAISTEADSSLNYKITKTDNNNNTIWEQFYDGWQNATDSVKAITMDSNNFIYVTGKSWNGFDYDIATVKYDTAGNQYWTAIYNDLDIGNDEPYLIQVDSAFKILIYAHSGNDSVDVYKKIYYSQCDTNCIPQRKPGFEKDQLFTEFNIQPNPASAHFNVAIQSNTFDETYQLILFDSYGKQALTQLIKRNAMIDVSRLAKGLYQVQLNSLDGRDKFRSKKIIIN